MNAEKEMDSLLERSASKNVASANVAFVKLSDVTKGLSKGMVKWSRMNSLWPLLFGLSCCAIELMDFGSSRIDAERKGYLLFRASPRQCDVMVVAGTRDQSSTDFLHGLLSVLFGEMRFLGGGTLMTGGVGMVVGTVFGVLIEGIMQTIIAFQGNLNSWWTRIAVAVLLMTFIVVQRVLVLRREGKKKIRPVEFI